MFVTLDKKFLRETEEDAEKKSIEMSGRDGEGSLIWENLYDGFDQIDFEENEIQITISNELGTFSIDIPIDTAFLEQILSVAVKRMNKIKTMLESLK